MEKCLLSSFAYLLIGLLVLLGLSFVSSLYILDINPLSDVLVNMFSHLVGCLFILLMISFSVQNLFSLIAFSNILSDISLKARKTKEKNKGD